MVPNRSLITLTIVLATVGLVFCFAGSLSHGTVASAADDPNAYKALFVEKCSACHNLPDPAVLQNTKERWRGIVAQMARRADSKGIEINDQQQGQIVEYLGQFPPKVAPGATGPLAPRREDVWDSEATKSQVYTFSTADHLASFRFAAGKWAYSPTLNAVAQSTPLADAAGAAMLIHKGDAPTGGLDLQAAVQFGTSAGKAAGLVFGLTDAKNYNGAVVDAVRGQIQIVAVRSGVGNVVATFPLGEVADPNGWHVIRVMYRPQPRRVTVWVDANKKAVGVLPDYADGQYGIATIGATTASFRNLYADSYGN